MEKLCYSALDIAAIINSMDLSCQAQANFLNQIWENEKPFLQKTYRNDKHKMVSEVFYWLTYLSDKMKIDEELPTIQKDVQASGREINESDYSADLDLTLFFKSARLRILYGGGKDYVRIKRKTLMAGYDYKKLTAELAEHFNQCIYFYHLQPSVKQKVKSNIKETRVDDMIVFRVV